MESELKLLTRPTWKELLNNTAALSDDLRSDGPLKLTGYREYDNHKKNQSQQAAGVVPPASAVRDRKSVV